LTNENTVMANLMAVIEDRQQNPPDRSYTTSLFAGGVEKIGAKIIEESAEVVEAATEEGDEGRDHLVYEASDLVYHLLVMLAHRGIGLQEVEAELARRFSVSGLDEKESR
jgi:phosphoribosyl-ATP pyrophosphohydrolase